jgi:hypothetical protein
MGGGFGTLILSVDLELDLDHQDSPGQERLDYVRGQLLEGMRQHELPATWAVADPALSVATESILAANASHEIAVLGDQAWVGQGAGRLRLSRELERRFGGARKAGIGATTLALRNVDQLVDLDILLDHGITAVRGAAVNTAQQARKLAAPPIRFGVWQVPSAWRIPPQPAWWAPSTWSICREIKRAINGSSLIHLEIDAPRLVESSEHELATILRVLRFAASRRDAGKLQIHTIRQIAERTLAERAALPSRSILKPAA